MSIYKQTADTEKAENRRKVKKLTYPQRLIQPLLKLYIDFKKEPVGGKVLIFLFFILPWNLGKHFEKPTSFINGVLSSYLIPTLYLQDILIFCLVAYLVIGQIIKHKGRNSDNSPSLSNHGAIARLSFLFLVSCVFSLFFVDGVAPSIYLFCRVLLYFSLLILGLRLFGNSLVRSAFLLSLVLNIVFLSVLGLLQFANQRSVFSNYLFFGEQPYNVYTPYIAKESYDGVAKIPPYGLFGHPNVFAGYLCVSLTLLVWLTIRYALRRKGLRSCAVMAPVVVLGMHTLFLTRSLTGICAFLLGVSLLLFVVVIRFAFRNKSHACVGETLTGVPALFPVALGLFTIAFGFLFPVYGNFVAKVLPHDSVLSMLSVDRRAALLESAMKMLEHRPFYGWGLNSFVRTFQQFYEFSDVVRFIQPVHNVYALLASEVGLVGLVWFVALTLYGVFYSFRYGSPVYGIILLEIVFMSSFDHYFFTIHQTLLLFVLTLGFALTYTENINCL